MLSAKFQPIFHLCILEIRSSKSQSCTTFSTTGSRVFIDFSDNLLTPLVAIR
nr:MAG TPA: hypothetical protein [Caudoviricetes sp.]